MNDPHPNTMTQAQRYQRRRNLIDEAYFARVRLDQPGHSAEERRYIKADINRANRLIEEIDDLMMAEGVRSAAEGMKQIEESGRFDHPDEDGVR